MEVAIKQQTEQLGFQDAEADEIRRMFVGSNPKLLALSMVVAVLHMFFEYLAIRSDIAFWSARKDHKSRKGISIRSVLSVTFCQIVVFLYIVDQGASLLVTVPQGVGLAVEIWKSVRALAGYRLRFRKGVPTLVLESELLKGLEKKTDDVKPDDDEKKDKDLLNSQASIVDIDSYDGTAAKYLNMALYPLVGVYSCFSLVYNLHKGWYGWIISSLYGVVFVFGFIAMTPQLFINYKMKSVAHMPWQTMVYKFFNTFVDDLFAFVIPMPLLHRLACFRDDIVFFIFLYQRYFLIHSQFLLPVFSKLVAVCRHIYPIDKSRRERIS
eukprot:scaffold8135_cov417-Prasinococcus_capsulatus_cf.AAC.1